MTTQHRIAVIGFGRWGPNHARNLSQMPQVDLVAVVDPDVERLRAATSQYKWLRVFPALSDLLAWGAFDCAVVSTPATDHVATVSSLLEAGKHVLCEKPLTTSSAQSSGLAQAASNKGLILMVGNVFLFNGGICYLKGLIDRHDLGVPRYASCIRTNLGPIRADVNAAQDLAAHDVSIIDYLMGGAPTWVSATGNSYVQAGVEDVVFVTLGYNSRFVSHIEASWLNPRKVRQITFVGSERMAVWDDLAIDRPLSIYERTFEPKDGDGDYGEFIRLSVRDGDVYLPKVDARQPLLLEDQAFLKAIELGHCSTCDADSAVRQNVVLEAVCESIRQRGAPVEVGIPVLAQSEV